MKYCVVFTFWLCIAAIHVAPSSQEDVNNEACDDETLKKKLSEPGYHLCIEEHLNITALLHDIKEAFNYKNIGDFVDKHCPKWKAFISCINVHNKDILQCASGETAEVVRSNMNAMNAAVGYICDSPSSILSEFFSGGGVHCLMQQEPSLQDCLVDENSELLVNTKELADIGFPAIHSVPKFYDFIECNVYHNVSSCIHKVLDQCESKVAKQFFNQLLIVMLQETPCWDALKSLEDTSLEHMVLISLLPKMVPTRARTCPGGGTGFEMAKKEVVLAVNCWNENIDTSAFLEEVSSQTTDAKDISKGVDFMRLVKNYCQKLETVDDCLLNFLGAFIPCANDTEKVVITSTKNMIQTALDFICYRNGERVLLFLKDEGPECYKNKGPEVKKCIEEATSINITEMTDNVEGDLLNKLWLPQSYDEKECKLMRSAEECLRTVMRQCDERTPANLLASLMKMIRKQTPCDTDKAMVSSASFWLTFSALIIALFLHKS
jgi:hypothetical protein